jgi:hypothetical protein
MTNQNQILQNNNPNNEPAQAINGFTNLSANIDDIDNAIAALKSLTTLTIIATETTFRHEALLRQCDIPIWYLRDIISEKISVLMSCAKQSIINTKGGSHE